jgi:4-amino-4-deoxy-L-arabinose transferase-like glycosyltransferase
MSSLPQNPGSKRAILVLASICVLVLPALCFYPFHTDHAIQQAMGLELYRYHGLPYIGSWDHNFPGTVFLHATAIALFGNSVLGFRAFELTLQIAIMLSLYKLSHLWLGEGASLVACSLYALFYVHGPGQFMGQRDDFAVLPLAWAFWASVKAYRNTSLASQKLFFTLAGGLFALATSIRPTLALLLIIPFVTLYDLRNARVWQLLLFEVMGFMAIVLLWLLPYALTPDGLRQAYLSTIRFNLDVYTGASFHLRDISNRIYLVIAFLLWWAAVMTLHRRRGRHFSNAPHSKKERNFMIASFAALLFGVIVMYRIASYHLMPFCAFFMPVLAAGIWDAKLRLGRRGSLALGALMIVLFAGLYPWKMVFGPQGRAIIFSSKPLAERLTGNPIDDSVVSYINSYTKPDEAVEVSAFFPDIRWQIERPPATRFTTLTGILLRRKDGRIPDFQRQWQAEYVANIEQVRPKFYIVQNAADSGQNIFTLRDLMALPTLGAFIQQNYTLDTTMGDYFIYRRK